MPKNLTLSFIDKTSRIEFSLTIDQARELARALTVGADLTAGHEAPEGPSIHIGLDKLPQVELRASLADLDLAHTTIKDLPEITPDHGALFLDPAKYSSSSYKGN